MLRLVRSQESLLTALEGWGFEVARPRLAPTASAEELVEFHRRLARDRSSLGYAVDGVVYKLDNLALQVRGTPRFVRCLCFGPSGTDGRRGTPRLDMFWWWAVFGVVGVCIH